MHLRSYQQTLYDRTTITVTVEQNGTSAKRCIPGITA